MDIIELSHKMEADLLESHSKDYCNLEPQRNENFSPRVTRSKTNNGQRGLCKETDVDSQEERNSSKINEVEKVFLSHKKSKTLHKKLETIYEEPIWKKGNTVFVGTNKVKRSIYLGREFRITSKQKSKLRKVKIKRLGKRIKPFKISDEEFKNRMQSIEVFMRENDLCENEDCNTEFNNFDNIGHQHLQNQIVNSHASFTCSISENKDFRE